MERLVRALYALAAIAAVVSAFVLATGRPFASFGPSVWSFPAPMNLFAGGILVFSALLVLGFAGVFAYRARHPLWWAKLVGAATFPWIFFSVTYSVQALMAGRWDAISALAPGMGGVLGILAALMDLVLMLRLRASGRRSPAA